MKPQDTGSMLEEMIIPVVIRAGYSFKKQVVIGNRPSGKKHVIDLILNQDSRSVLVSLKWQQVSGTAEQKIPFEIICLEHAVLATENEVELAYLILAGNGWTLKEFYVSGGLNPYIKSPHVKVIKLEDFIAMAMKKGL